MGWLAFPPCFQGVFDARSPNNRGGEVPSYCMHLKRHRNVPPQVAKCFAQWPSRVRSKCFDQCGTTERGTTKRFEKPLKHFDTSGIMDTTFVEGPETLPTVGALPPGPDTAHLRIMRRFEVTWAVTSSFAIVFI